MQYCVYIMTNERNTVLYIGVTGKISERIYQHKMKVVEGFTKRYNIDKLVYCEVHETPEGAILREKKLKGSSRARKIKLINKINPDWNDLSDTLF